MTTNVYQLIAVCLDTRTWGDRRIHKQKDGSILTHEQHLGIFTTVENAERMSRFKGSDRGDDSYWGLEVAEA